MRVLTRTPTTTASAADGTPTYGAPDGAGPVHSQRLLVATGRRADLKALGVARGHRRRETQSFIAVDDRLRAADGVWSVGRRHQARGRSRASRCIKRA